MTIVHGKRHNLAGQPDGLSGAHMFPAISGYLMPDEAYASPPMEGIAPTPINATQQQDQYTSSMRIGQSEEPRSPV
jgi:hypothetical protein